MGSAWWKFGDKPWPSSSWLRSASRLRHRSMPSYESPLRVAKERGKELRTRANLDAAADNSEMTCRCLNSEKAQRCVKAVPWTCWDPGGRGFLLCRLGFIPAAKTLIDRPGPLGFWAERCKSCKAVGGTSLQLPFPKPSCFSRRSSLFGLGSGTKHGVVRSC